jgi:hypothetical protein
LEISTDTFFPLLQKEVTESANALAQDKMILTKKGPIPNEEAEVRWTSRQEVNRPTLRRRRKVEIGDIWWIFSTRQKRDIHYLVVADKRNSRPMLDDIKLVLMNLRTCLEQLGVTKANIPIDEMCLRNLPADELRGAINSVFGGSTITPIIWWYARKRNRELNPRPTNPQYSHDWFRTESTMPTCIVLQDSDLLQLKGSLAHCVSSDFKMSRGVALEISHKYPAMKRMSPDTPSPHLIGKTMGYKIPGQEKWIFNIVTKEKYTDKPTYEDFIKAIASLKEQVTRLKITRLNMPMIGCGIDRLNWQYVRDILERAFSDTDCTLMVTTRD